MCLQDIEVVINFDFPPGKTSGIEDYVHRIGRTARGQRTGIAHSFFSPEDYHNAKDLVGILDRCGQEVSAELRSIATPRRPARPMNAHRNVGSRYGGGKFGGNKGGFDRSTFDPIGSGGGKKRQQQQEGRFASKVDRFGDEPFERRQRSHDRESRTRESREYGYSR